MKIAFKLDTKIDRYSILALYLLVLVMGFLRLDQQIFSDIGSIALNPFGFVSDIKADETSILIMIINLVIFTPMYFLINHANVFNSFLPRFYWNPSLYAKYPHSVFILWFNNDYIGSRDRSYSYSLYDPFDFHSIFWY